MLLLGKLFQTSHDLLHRGCIGLDSSTSSHIWLGLGLGFRFQAVAVQCSESYDPTQNMWSSNSMCDTVQS